MNSLIRLVTQDFSMASGTKGPLLTVGIKGIVLILFWSPSCPLCTNLLPKFQHLPQIISGVKFCVLNINENQQVLAMAKQTIAPIEYVPYIVLYVNGKPFLQFDDEPSLEKLTNFVTYTMKLIESKKQFIDKGAKIESEIPAYCTNKPYLDLQCDDNVCYLTSHGGNKTVTQGDSGGCLTYTQAYGTKAQTKLDKTNENEFRRS